MATHTATDLSSVSYSSLSVKRKRGRKGTRKRSNAGDGIKANNSEDEAADVNALYSPTLMASATQKMKSATLRKRGKGTKNKRQPQAKSNNNNNKTNYYGPTSPSRDDATPQQTRKLIGSTLSTPGYDAMDCSEDDDEEDVAAMAIAGTTQNERLLQLKQKEATLLKKKAQRTIDPWEEGDNAITVEQRLREAKEQLRLAQCKRDELAQIRHEEISELENNNKDKKPVEEDATDPALKKKKAKALKKQLHAMKLRHAAAAAAQQLHHNEYQKQQGQKLPPLTALQEGKLDTLVVRDIGKSGPNDRVRFLKAFEPPVWFSGEEASIPLEQTTLAPQLSNLDQFADAPSDETGVPTPLPPPISLTSAVGSYAVVDGQFDDLVEEDNPSSAEDAPPVSDTLLAGQPVLPKATETEVLELPQVFAPGEEATDQHLKSISTLKRKMELKRKAIELKEKLQRLGTNGKHNSYRSQNVSWSRGDTINIEGEGDVGVKDSGNTEALEDELYVPLSMANLSKEELEERRLLAQQNMDVSQTKHFVSKQTYMLAEQQKKVNSNEEEIQQCRVLISEKRKELQDESTLQDDLQARKSAVNDMIQKQIKILVTKRVQLNNLRQQRSSKNKSNEQMTVGDTIKSQQGQQIDNKEKNFVVDDSEKMAQETL